MYLNTEAVSASDSDEDEEGLSSQNSEGAHLIVPDDDSGDSTNAVDKEYLSDSMKEQEEGGAAEATPAAAVVDSHR
jgi:hypothetical protein